MNTEKEPPFDDHENRPPGDGEAEGGQERWEEDLIKDLLTEDPSLFLGPADQVPERVQPPNLDNSGDLPDGDNPFDEAPRPAVPPGIASSGIEGLQAKIDPMGSEGGGVGVEDDFLAELLRQRDLEQKSGSREDEAAEKLPLFTSFEKALERYGFGDKFQEILGWVVKNFGMEELYCYAQAWVNCTVHYPGWPPQFPECTKQVCNSAGVKNLNNPDAVFTFHRFGLWGEFARDRLNQAIVYGETFMRLFDRTRQVSKRDPDVFKQGLEKLARFIDWIELADFDDEEGELLKPETWKRRLVGQKIRLRIFDSSLIICDLNNRGHGVLASPAILVAKPFWDTSGRKGWTVPKIASGGGTGATDPDSLVGSMDFKIRLFPYLPYEEPNTDLPYKEPSAEGEHLIRIARDDKFGVVVISRREVYGFDEIAGLLFCNFVKDQAGRRTLIVALEELVPPGYLFLQSWRTDSENRSPQVRDVRNPFLQIPSDWFRDPKMLSLDLLNFLRMVVAVRKDLEVLEKEGMEAYLKRSFGRRKNAARLIEGGVEEYLNLLESSGFKL